MLTSYDRKTITYDNIGNPLTDSTWTYTWEHGRQLAGMRSGTTTWTYPYDVSGMRTSRSNQTSQSAGSFLGRFMTASYMDFTAYFCTARPGSAKFLSPL